MGLDRTEDRTGHDRTGQGTRRGTRDMGQGTADRGQRTEDREPGIGHEQDRTMATYTKTKSYTITIV